ncbi:MAG TPA: glycosyltransferase [Bryobacteraceae bacterium]|nr:glycosyltransferase [Bryobacteraceae bacterium]
MRAAIVHYWLLNWRGGEKVLESLCQLLPDADIFTLFYDPRAVSPEIRRHKVTASFLNPLRRHYRNLLPLMPLALEQFDLRGYDLVISSESGPAKGVLTSASTRHLCYCHTPMRYIWDLYPVYLKEWLPAWKRILFRPVSNYLRLWDFASAARVDEFVANSENVRRRIQKAWRREAQVVYPPVAVDNFYWREPEDYYLIVSELVAYKRVDMAVRAFTRLGRRLCVVGDGPEFKHLKHMAGPRVEFCGRVSDDELRGLLARCRALVVPGEEDFGMTPVEALASGKPVIALGRGGSLESVPTTDPLGGVFFDDPDESQLAEAVQKFELIEAQVRPRELQAWAQQFSELRFLTRMREVIGPESSWDRPPGPRPASSAPAAPWR